MQLVGRATRVTAAAALLVALAACSDDPSGDPSATPTPTSSATGTGSSSPTDSPTPPTDGEVAAKSAEDTVREYYSVRNRLRQDASLPLRLMRTVSISTDLAAQLNFLKKQRESGLTQVGDTEIAELKVQSVDLDNSDPKAGRVPTVVIDVCYDVSSVDIVDADGDSVVSRDRADRGWVRHSVANYKWATDPAGSWRVASSETLELKPCTAP